MSLWRSFWMLPLCIGCDGDHGETTKSSTSVLLEGKLTTCTTTARYVAIVGQAMTFTGEASRIESTCGCKYHGDNRPAGCGFDSDTCESEYDLGAPNPTECTDAPPTRSEIVHLHAVVEGGDCAIEAERKDDDTTYAGTLTCAKEGTVYLTVGLETEDGTFDKTIAVDVLGADGACPPVGAASTQR